MVLWSIVAAAQVIKQYQFNTLVLQADSELVISVAWRVELHSILPGHLWEWSKADVSLPTQVW